MSQERGKRGRVPRVSCMHSVCWWLLLACSGYLCAMRTRSGRAVGVHFAIRVDVLCERRRGGGDGHALRYVHGQFLHAFCSPLGNVEATGGGAGAGAFIRASGVGVLTGREGGRRAADTHSGMFFLRVKLIVR
jgi:hypothetical protein